MTEQVNTTEFPQLQTQLTREVVEVNSKHIKLPFFSVIPQTTTDMRLMLEEFNPEELMKWAKEGEDIDFLNAVSYRVFEHDSVVRDFKGTTGQRTLIGSSVPFGYFNQAKLKLIEPASELYRMRYIGYLGKYALLEQIPPYVK